MTDEAAEEMGDFVERGHQAGGIVDERSQDHPLLRVSVTHCEFGVDELGGYRIAFVALRAEVTDLALIFERALNPTPAEIAAGLDTYTIGTADGLSAYGGLRNLELDGSQIRLRLDAFAAGDLGMAELMEIDLCVPDLDTDGLRDHLQLVLGSHAVVHPQ